MKSFFWFSLEYGDLCMLSRCFQLQRGWCDLHTSVAIAGTFQMSEAHGWVSEVLWSHCSSWCPGWLKVLVISLHLSKSHPTMAHACLSSQELSTTGIRPIAECRWISLAWRYKLVARMESYLNIFFPLDWHKEGACSLPPPRTMPCVCVKAALGPRWYVCIS